MKYSHIHVAVLPKCFTIEQSTVKASIFVLWETIQ